MARWVFPLDPECPEVINHYQSFSDDPMSKYAPMDDINEAFEAKHRKNCKRCQEYGAANVDIGD
jgi:hypothetical protein